MDLEIIILSEVSQKEIPYDITYMWNLKYDTNEFIYETETGRPTDRKKKIMVIKGEREKRDKLGAWD